ncbi:MAG: malonyl-CoA decarboxylase [Pseudorhodobacter sp.]
MSLFAEVMTAILSRRAQPQPEITIADQPIDELCRAMVAPAGEASLAAIGYQILRKYEALDTAEKKDFFGFLAKEMTFDPDLVLTSLDALREAETGENYRAFMEAAEPPRQELIRRLNQIPDATGRLVRMRQDLLGINRDDRKLQALDLDFRHLFASWFNRGFLVLRRISWESPAHILEKIITYEAVHAIDSWDELRRRLEPEDRRCFAFFHPAMPDEPLIFVEVALTRGIPASIQLLLDQDREHISPNDANTAVFYSISNCQTGLAGISFGNSLIKQVAADLSIELPNLGTFVTLSPIPGFARWLVSEGLKADTDEPGAIERMAARYLLTAKRGDGQPLDPVARFHLGNGAELHAIHARADLSERGQAQSHGAMVNYLYDLQKAVKRQEDYVVSHKITATADICGLPGVADETRQGRNK